MLNFHRNVSFKRKIILQLILLSLLLVKLIKADDQKNENNNDNKKKLVCYYTNWSQYRQVKYFPENIERAHRMCTHIIYAFARLSESERLDYLEWNDETPSWAQSDKQKGSYERLTDLKKKNPQLKILIAVGGWNAGSAPFSELVHSENKMMKFAASTVDFLKKNKFDGLDLDWEYPGSRDGSRPTDKQKFVDLVRLLKEAFKPHGFQLTAAVPVGKANIDRGFQIDELSKYLDFINLMTYDFHGSWEQIAAHNAPLRPRNDEINSSSGAAYLNIEWAVKYWLANGAPRSKLILGVPLYGRSFTLVDPFLHSIGSPTKSAGQAGEFTREAGFLSYYEICTRLNSSNTNNNNYLYSNNNNNNNNNNNWKVEYDNEQKVKFAYRGDQWVGYDDTETLKFKLDFGKELNLGGVMVWSLDLDDFTGNWCNQGKYPLLSFIRRELFGDEFVDYPPGTSTTATTTTSRAAASPTRRPPASSSLATTTTMMTTRTRTTVTTMPVSPIQSQTRMIGIGNGLLAEKKQPMNAVKCPHGDGYYADLESKCSRYYLCLSSKIQDYQCPKGLKFDVKLKACNFNAKIQCDNIGNGGFDQIKTLNNNNNDEVGYDDNQEEEVAKILCPNGNGFYTNYESNCTKYYFCAFLRTPNEKIFYYDCPSGTQFNIDTKSCEKNFKCLLLNQQQQNSLIFKLSATLKSTNNDNNEVVVATSSSGDSGGGSMRMLADDAKHSRASQICVNGDGVYVDKRRLCEYYYECLYINTEYARVFERSCPRGTVYDRQRSMCNWRHLVVC